VHVVTEIVAPAWLKPVLSIPDRHQLAAARHHLASLAAAAAPHADIDVAVAYGAIGEQVAAIADGTSAQLIVTTLRDQHRWSGPKRGSISYQVLSHANVPVLACPPRWRMR
jgi:nucleotide-binding universal stress UspA family protein